MAAAEAEIAIFGENVPDGDGHDREGVAEIIVGAANRNAQVRALIDVEKRPYVAPLERAALGA
jgi:hypothetical protein